MAAFFLLLTILVGVVLGDALVENDGAGVLTVFGQTTGRFNQGQMLLVFAGLGFLFALLLGLSLASTRRRRARRKERRSGRRELEERITELERDNARLTAELGQRGDALTGREAELAHRDRQLALKDEELARRDQELQGARARDAARPEAREPTTPEATEILERPAPTASEVVDRPAPTATDALDRTAPRATEAPDQAVVAAAVEAEPVAPLHDEPPWLGERRGDEEPTVVRTATDEERNKPVEGADRAPMDAPARRTEKPDQNS